MITRIIKVKLPIENVESFATYMKEFVKKAKMYPNIQHADFFSDKEEDGQFLIYTIWKTQGALSKFRKSELNLEFIDRLNNWSKDPYTAWTVENVF